MGINLQQAQNQANKISTSASELQQVKNILLLFKGRLQNSWQAEEMHYISLCIDQLIQKTNNLSNELYSLSSDIKTAANEVKREEDLAEAKAQLSNATVAFNNAKQNYIRIQNLYYSNPSDAIETSLNIAKRNYYSALSKYNSAAAKVRSLS